MNPDMNMNMNMTVMGISVNCRILTPFGYVYMKDLRGGDWVQCPTNTTGAPVQVSKIVVVKDPNIKIKINNLIIFHTHPYFHIN